MRRPPSRRRATRRRRLLRPASVVVLLLALWVVLAGLTVYWASQDANDGLDAVSEAQTRTAPADLAAARPLEPLRRAGRSFDSSSRLLGSPVLAPARILPVVGRQLRSAHALMGAAGEVSTTGAEAVADARAALDEAQGSGPQRVVLAQRLAEVADRAERRLSKLDLGPSRALIAPLASRRQELVDKLERIRGGLGDARALAVGLGDILAGPRRYLVLAANNSEMRAGSGMFLSVGELSVANGDFSLSDFRPTGDLLVPVQAAPPIQDQDLAGRWAWLKPNQEWRNLGLSPRFPASAELAARMWGAVGGQAVDGVLALDPVTLRAFLRVTGPVSAGGRTVSADNVVDLLLHDQYVGLRSTDVGAQAGRREQLGTIARASVDALRRGDWDVEKLIPGLAEAARGRHLLAWSARPAEKEAWEAARVDGRLESSSLSLAVLNRGGNKLDRFLDVDADLALERKGQVVDATLRVVLQNPTPEGEPSYVAGPHPELSVQPGEYVGILSVNLPGSAGSVTVEGRETFVAAGPDGPTKVVAVPVQLARGTAQSLTVRFALAGAGSLRVEPSARVPPVTWTAAGQSWASGEARQVPFG